MRSAVEAAEAEEDEVAEGIEEIDDHRPRADRHVGRNTPEMA